jgi:hypothetical protein
MLWINEPTSPFGMLFYLEGSGHMTFLNHHISIDTVPGKSYCKLQDDCHLYFIPSELCIAVEDYVHRKMFEGLPVSSLQQWYLSLSMKTRTSIIVVLIEKIA